MKIESIKVGRYDKEKLVIRVEGGGYISARVDDAYSLRVGDEISEEEAARLNASYSSTLAKKSAAKTLAKRSLSRGELSKKLRDKGFSEEESEDAVEWFSSRGFIDDQSYARSCVEYYKARGYGIVRIKEELRRREISKEISEKLISELGSFSDELLALIEKKTRGEGLDADKKRKLIAFLCRRGFKYDEIRTALENARIDTEEIF